MTSCILVDRYQPFGVACLYLSRYTTSDPKRTVIFALITVRTSKPQDSCYSGLVKSGLRLLFVTKTSNKQIFSSEVDRRPAGRDLSPIVEYVRRFIAVFRRGQHCDTVTRDFFNKHFKYYLSTNVCVIGFVVKVSVHVSYIVLDMVIPTM